MKGAEAAQPGPAEMSQGTVANTGPRSLITGKMSVQVDAMKEKNFWIFLKRKCFCSCCSAHLKCLFLSIFNPSILEGSAPIPPPPGSLLWYFQLDV